MGLPGVYRADIRAEDQFRTVPDRSPGVPIDFEQIDFSVPMFCYFSFQIIVFQSWEPPAIIGGCAGTFLEYMFIIRYI